MTRFKSKSRRSFRRVCYNDFLKVLLINHFYLVNNYSEWNINLINLIYSIFRRVIFFFNRWRLLLCLFFHFFQHLLLLELKLCYLLLLLAVLSEIQVKTSASSWLISNYCRRTGFRTTLSFCGCPFNQLLFNINFKFFCYSVCCGTSILTLFGVTHHSNIWIISVLMLCLLSQYKVSFRLHSDLIFVVCLFQEWGSYLVQTLLVLSIAWETWVPSLNRRWLVWLVAEQSSVLILVILRLRI